MGDIEEAELAELFDQAEDALHPQSMNASASGWMAIRELFKRLGYVPDEWDDMDSKAKRDTVYNWVDGRVFVTLQREADKRGIDVDYGYGEPDDATQEVAVFYDDKQDPHPNTKLIKRVEVPVGEYELAVRKAVEADDSPVFEPEMVVDEEFMVMDDLQGPMKFATYEPA